MHLMLLIQTLLDQVPERGQHMLTIRTLWDTGPAMAQQELILV